MTKTISLADDAYEALVSVKGARESFSELARRAARRLRADRILELAGAWSGMTKGEADALKKKVRSWRDEGREPRYRFG